MFKGYSICYWVTELLIITLIPVDVPISLIISIFPRTSIRTSASLQSVTCRKNFPTPSLAYFSEPITLSWIVENTDSVSHLLCIWHMQMLLDQLSPMRTSHFIQPTLKKFLSWLGLYSSHATVPSYFTLEGEGLASILFYCTCG